MSFLKSFSAKKAPVTQLRPSTFLTTAEVMEKSLEHIRAKNDAIDDAPKKPARDNIVDQLKTKKLTGLMSIVERSR